MPSFPYNPDGITNSICTAYHGSIELMYRYIKNISVAMKGHVPSVSNICISGDINIYCSIYTYRLERDLAYTYNNL